MNDMKPAVKRKWWRVALVGVIALVVMLCGLIALAPTLVSSGIARGMIESRVGEAVHGTARIGSLSLGWFGSQQVSGVELRDAKGETDVRVDLKLDNGLLDLALGRVDCLRVNVSGSIQARMLPEGGTSLSNLASGSTSPAAPVAPAATNSASRSKPGHPLDALPFPVKLTIGTFDLTLSDAQATAFAVKGLKGSVGIGRGQPLAIDLAATTQIGDRGGSFAARGNLDGLFDSSGAIDLAGMSGDLDVQVSGWLAALSGLNAELQAAAVRVQAPAGKPLGIALNAAVRVDGGAMTAQAQMTAARPAATQSIVAWATDPRTWIGQVTLKGVPTASLQRFVASTPLVLTRDVGPALDVTLQTGEGAGVDLSASADRLKLVARAKQMGLI